MIALSQIKNNNIQMKIGDKSSWVTRQLGKEEEIPYDLLLLADETVEAINKYIFDSDIYVMEQDNNLIGIYVLCSLNKNETEIKNIAVSKAYQGQGIGRFLMQDAAIKAKEEACKSILIGTAVSAIKQISLYQIAGFEIFDVKCDFFTRNYPEPIFEDGLQLRHMIMLRQSIK